MKYGLQVLVLLLLLTLALATAQGASKKKYKPTERIPADTAVAFPVDI